VAAGPPQTSAGGLLRPTLGEDRLLQKQDDAYSDRLVRHEVLRDRVEVKDHHRRVVAAAW
jgi:hypothetical protein